jgi:hypothetical protein
MRAGRGWGYVRRFSGEVVTSMRERVAGWAYLLGWKAVCRPPRRNGAFHRFGRLAR